MKYGEQVFYLQSPAPLYLQRGKMATPFIMEIMNDINADPNLLKHYINNEYVRQVMLYAFVPGMKMKLPEGEVNYKPSQALDYDLAYANFYYEQKRWYIFLDNYSDPKVQKNVYDNFTQLLEGLHEEEARLMLHIKDQNLTEMFPNITVEKLEDAGYITEEVMYAYIEQNNLRRNLS